MKRSFLLLIVFLFHNTTSLHLYARDEQWTDIKKTSFMMSF